MPLIVPSSVMALPLPTLSSFEEYSSLAKTVYPYIPQLYELPNQLLAAGTDTTALTEIYIRTNPLISTAAIAIFLTPFVWAASEINRNYSQVDRLWSIVPTLYISNYILYAHVAGLETERLDMLGIAFGLWSARLTFNYWRKGGYSIGSEDYRWMIVKNYVNNEAIWFVFNLTFIVIYQMILLFMISTPAYILLLATYKGMPIALIDTVAPKLVIAFVIMEFMADQQQWNYQTAKASYKKTAVVPRASGFDTSDLDRGFIVSGLWSFCRHPNFACEQAIWITLYQWSCFITDSYFNWTAAGVIGLLGIFQGSTWLTELITAGKYEQYGEYQARVNRFMPTWSTELPANWEEKKRNKGVVGKAAEKAGQEVLKGQKGKGKRN